jgi:hypothetical protein
MQRTCPHCPISSAGNPDDGATEGRKRTLYTGVETLRHRGYPNIRPEPRGAASIFRKIAIDDRLVGGAAGRKADGNSLSCMMRPIFPNMRVSVWGSCLSAFSCKRKPSSDVANGLAPRIVLPLCGVPNVAIGCSTE